MSELLEPVILGEYDICSSCHTPLVFANSHEVCPACGLVGPCTYFYLYHGSTHPISEVVRVHENGQRTEIGEGQTPLTNPFLKDKDLRRMKFRDWQPNCQKSRHFRKALPELFRIAGILQFSRERTDQMTYFYLQAFNTFPITNVELVAITACYLTIRDNELPIRMEELLQRVNTTVTPKRAWVWLRKYLRCLKYQMKPINIPKMIIRYGENLKLPFSIIREAICLYDHCSQQKIFGSCNPWIITAGILYSTLSASRQFKVSQRELSERFFVSIVAIREMAQRIQAFFNR